MTVLNCDFLLLPGRGWEWGGEEVTTLQGKGPSLPAVHPSTHPSPNPFIPDKDAFLHVLEAVSGALTWLGIWADAA